MKISFSVFCASTSLGDNLQRMSVDLIKRKGFHVKKTKTKLGYSAESITDADYADDLALLENIPAQAEGGIGLYINANKNRVRDFNQKVPSPF